MATTAETTLLTPKRPYSGTRTTSRGSIGYNQTIPEHAVASSPLLRDGDTSLPYRPPNSQRSSMQSSIRLSTDSTGLRWDGNESDITSVFRDGDTVGASSADEQDTTETEEPKSPVQRRATGELTSYAALSQRADFILASAKRKLSLLEGNLKGARYSLHTPTQPSYRASDSVTTSAIPRYFPTTSSEDDSERPNRGPRINFGTPRHGRIPQPKWSDKGHARGFSDTSVPSQPSPAFRGSMTVGTGRNREPRVRSSMLEPVAKPTRDTFLSQVDETDDSQTSDVKSGDESSASQDEPAEAPTAQTLRTEADEVRNRLSLIQERVRQEAEARQNMGASAKPPVTDETAVIKQVQALEQSLEQQEEVIEQLERAEKIGHHDPRGEWKQMLDRSGWDGDDSESGGESDEDNDNDFSSVLEFPGPGEEELNLDGAHEDRADAFDYEHFILHSVLGTYSNVAPGRRQGSDSGSSVSTTRGPTEQDGALTSKESVASFATARTGSDDDNVSQNESSEDEMPDNMPNSWPMPPPSVASRAASSVFVDSRSATPAFPPTEKTNGVSHGAGHRPASLVFSALMGPESAASSLPGLDEQDQALVYSLAEGLREACLQLQRSYTTTPADSAEWRLRLDEARRILTGE